MLILDTLLLLSRHVRRWLLVNRRIALVAAHGNLHPGHLQLIVEAKRHADIVVLALLPEAKMTPDNSHSHLQEDCELLSRAEVDVLFVASHPTLYPGYPAVRTVIQPPPIAAPLDKDQPTVNFGFYVTTLCKLLNLVQPDILCLGEKNYQQLRVVQQLICDLNYATQVVPVAIARDSNGLPYSRLYATLTTEAHTALHPLKRQLDWLVAHLDNGERIFSPLIEECRQKLGEAGLEPIQVQILDADSLRAVTVDSQRAVALLAVRFEGRMFSDNAIINLRN